MLQLLPARRLRELVPPSSAHQPCSHRDHDVKTLAGRFFSPFCEPLTVKLVDAAGNTPLELARQAVVSLGPDDAGGAAECVAMLRDACARERAAAGACDLVCCLPTVPGTATATASSDPSPGAASTERVPVGAAAAEDAAGTAQPESDGEYEYEYEVAVRGGVSDSEYDSASGDDGESDSFANDDSDVDYYAVLAQRVAAGLPTGLGSLQFYTERAQRPG